MLPHGRPSSAGTSEEVTEEEKHEGTGREQGQLRFHFDRPHLLRLCEPRTDYLRVRQTQGNVWENLYKSKDTLAYG